MPYRSQINNQTGNAASAIGLFSDRSSTRLKTTARPKWTERKLSNEFSKQRRSSPGPARGRGGREGLMGAGLVRPLLEKGRQGQVCAGGRQGQAGSASGVQLTGRLPRGSRKFSVI